MDPRPPRVSVCIPTYRGGAYLGAAIQSVLAQSLPDFELIVVDDHSPDDTGRIVSQYDDPRLVYLRNEINLRPEGNWNRCLELARGRYFKLLPHDDVLHPRCLERQVAVLEADSEEQIALVFSAREVLDPGGRVLMRRGYPGRREGRLIGADVGAACVRWGTNLVGEPGGILFRRGLAQIAGRFDATDPYLIDLDYWVRLLRYGDAYYHQEPLVGFRVIGSSWSVAIGKGQSADFRRLIQRHLASGVMDATRLDRLLGRVAPTLNKWARQIFYQLYVQ